MTNVMSVMDKTIDVSIVGPAMNEAGNIEEYVERCIKAFNAEKVVGEIIVVDDGSTDGTTEVLQKLIDKYPQVIKGFKHRKNLGLTQALKTGFANVSGDIIIWISTDLESYPDEDIPIFLKAFSEGADVVSGYRQGRGDGKIAASKIYNFVCRKLFGLKLRDMNWTKAFRRECLSFLDLRGDWHRFILIMLHSAGFKIEERGMTWYPRRYGKSKFGLMRFPRSFIDVISIWFLMYFSKKPMRLFGTLGMGAIFFGVLFHFVLVCLYFFASTQIRPLFWTALILELSGLQFILFGFLAENIERVRDKVDSPRSQHGANDIWVKLNNKDV